MRNTILFGILAISLNACGGGDKDKSGSTTESTLDKVNSATDNMVDRTADETGVLASNKSLQASDAARTDPNLTLGKDVYSGKCFSCHSSGVAGAPKLGDQTNWQPRIAQGMDTLLEHATTGFRGSAGYMPPKGGFSALSDAELSAAVSYMVSEAK